MIESKSSESLRRRENSETRSKPRLPAATIVTRVEIAAFVALALFATLPLLATVGADPDLFWQIRAGESILTDNAIPRIDSWSFTATGAEWTNHEWLTSVLLAKTYETAGAAGLLVFRGTVLIALVAGLVLAYRQRARQPIVSLPALLAVVPIFGTFISLRAHSLTYLLVIWTVVILDRVREGRLRWLVVLPVMTAMWANLHGGFVLGLALIGLSLLMLLFGWDGAVMRPTGRQRRLVIGAGIATVVATLANPYGPNLYAFLMDELGASHAEISEWEPISGTPAVFFWIYLLVPLALWLWAQRWRHIGLFVMFAGSTLLTVRSGRFLVLMGIFGSLVAVEAAGSLVRKARDAGRLERYRTVLDPRVALASGLVLFLVTGVSFSRTVASGGSAVQLDPGLYPIQATRWLEGQDVGPNLAVPLAYGGYAIWHLGPEMKVAVDGRNITVYEPDWVDRYLQALNEGRALEVLDASLVDAWMLPTDSPQIGALQRTGRWSVAYRDPVAVVILRGAHETVVGPPPPRSVEFPGPT